MPPSIKPVERQKDDCGGSGTFGRVYQFPIQKLPKKNDHPENSPPQLELIEGGKNKPPETPSISVYDHTLLGVGHHKGKPWEIAAAVREKLGLPAEERILLSVAHEVTLSDGRKAIVQMTDRAFARMQQEQREALHRNLRTPKDIGEHDY